MHGTNTLTHAQTLEPNQITILQPKVSMSRQDQMIIFADNIFDNDRDDGDVRKSLEENLEFLT